MNNTTKKNLVIITNGYGSGCGPFAAHSCPFPNKRTIAAKGNNEKCTKHIVPKIIGFPLFSYRIIFGTSEYGQYWAKTQNMEK